MKDIYREISSRKNLKTRLVIQAILVGAITGVIISAFRLLTLLLSERIYDLYNTVRGNPTKAILLLLLILAIGGLVGWMVKVEPKIGGSGIPQVSGQLHGLLQMDWKKVLPLKFVGGILSVSSGLKVGREGPSIQMGAAIGQGFSELCHRPKTEKKFLISSGAAAGLTSAFNAPLSGVIFALEEVHHNFSSVAFISAMGASLASGMVTLAIMGFQPVIEMGNLGFVPLRFYGWIILLGILAGLSAHIFTGGISIGKKAYARLKLPTMIKVMFPFLLTAIAILINIDNYGSGEGLFFLPLTSVDMGILDLFTTYCLSLILLIIAFCSGLPGGIFFPMLVLGSLFGNLYGQILSKLGLIDQQYILVLTVLSMCAYFSAVVRSPITGIILIPELTGSFDLLLLLGIVALVSYLTAELTRLKPVYEMLLSYQLHPELLDKRSLGAHESKKKEFGRDSILTEYPVYFNSVSDGATIKEIGFPPDCLLVSIRRGKEEILPKGNVKLQAGDYIVVVQKAYDHDKTRAELVRLTQEELDHIH